MDAGVVDAFRRRAVGSGRLPAEILDEHVENLLENLSLRDGEHLQRAEALLFHPSPGRLVPDSYIKIGYFRGPELLLQDEIEGALFAQVDRAMDLVYTKYTCRLASYDGIYRVETFPVPREAMREAVINAVIHYDYASPTTIQIRVRVDRIAIWNAALLKPEWTAELLAAEMSSRPRNPRIAYTFFRAEMIEEWGRGIRRIVDYCHDAGNPAPTWRVDAGGDSLWVRFPFSETYKAADATARGNSSVNTSPDTTQKPAGATRNRARDRIVDCLRVEPGLTRTALAERVDLSPDGVKYHLQHLKATGIIRRAGSDWAGRWEVLR